jgi:hypothetical protein
MVNREAADCASHRDQLSASVNPVEHGHLKLPQSGRGLPHQIRQRSARDGQPQWANSFNPSVKRIRHKPG